MSFGGPGQEKYFMNVLYILSNLFLLNILWIIFSLPVVTLGASTTALYSVTLKMVGNKESYICRSFVKAFRENLKQGTAIWMLYGGFGCLLYFNLYVAASGYLAGQGFFLTIFAVMALCYIASGIYLFPVLSRFQTSCLQILKIAAFLCFRHIIYTILILCIIILPLALIGRYLYFLPALLIIAVSGPAYIASKMFDKIFAQYGHGNI